MTDVNSLNYSEQGGAAWVVGGSLTITGTLDTANAAATPGSLRVVAVPLAAVATAGGVLAWANPAADAILVHSLILDITTASTATGGVHVILYRSRKAPDAAGITALVSPINA